MLSSETFLRNDKIPIIGSVFFLIIVLFCVHFNCESYVLAGFFGAALFISFFISTNILYYTYFASFFISIPVFMFFPIVIFVTDFLFPLVVAARLGSHFFHKKPLSSFTPDKQILIYMVVLFFIGLLSYGLNVIDHSFKLQLTGAFFLYRLLQAILVFVLFSDKNFNLNITIVFRVFIIMTFLQLPVVIIQKISLGEMQYIHGVTGTFYHHHASMGTFLLFPLFIALYLFYNCQRKREKLFFILLMFLAIYLILLSECRSALLGLLFSLMVFLLLHFKINLKRIITIASICIGVLIFLYFSPFFTIVQKTFFSRETGSLDISSLGRIIIWRDSMRFFIKEDLIRKLIGFGIGFSRETLEISFFFKRAHTIPSSHNNYLTAMMETGIVGLCAFILLYGTITCKLFLRFKRDNDYLSFSMFLLSVAFLGTCLTQETFWTQSFTGPLLICYFTIIALILRDNKKAPISEKMYSLYPV